MNEGWWGAILAALAYGSFGVPIRSTRDIPVHILVWQSYKTVVLWMTSVVVTMVFLRLPPPHWTPWGIVSGGLWVIGGTSGVLAIRWAGLTVAVGVWSTIMVLINFVVGLLIFKEKVANLKATLGAFILLTVGLIGMTKYSARQPDEVKSERFLDPLSDSEVHGEDTTGDSNSVDDEDEEVVPIVKRIATLSSKRNSFMSLTASLEGSTDDDERSGSAQVQQVEKDKTDDFVIVLGGGRLKLQRHTIGVLAAIGNGIMTGSSLIPLHYAKKQGFGGSRYLFSYATGALLVNTIIWVIFVGVQFLVQRRQCPDTGSEHSVWRQTILSLPSWHFQQLWKAGLLSGSLLTMGMLGAMVAVTHLGQGVGNSIVQAKILVGGLWGICWFGEIRGKAACRWIISACIAISGIIWLSAERIAAKGAT